MTTLDTRDNFPIKLNGVHYEIDLRSYRRNTVEATRAQQDQSSESSEQTLNNQYLWKRSGEDFGLGHAQKWFDADETTSRKRFESSLNVNVWDDRQVTLLNKTTNRLAGETNASSPYVGQPLSKSASWMFPLEGRLIYLFNTRLGSTVSGSNTLGTPYGWKMQVVNTAAASTWSMSTIFQHGITYTTGGGFGPSSGGGGGGGAGTTIFDSPLGSTITGASSDGSTIYFSLWGKPAVTQVSINPITGDVSVANNVGVSTNYYWSVHCVGDKVFAKHNSGTTTNLVELGVGTQTVIDSWPIDRDITLTSAIAGPDGIYWSSAGIVNSSRADWASQKSIVYRSNFNETTATYNPLSPITSFPEGEVINTMLEYSGYILFGTTKGFRLGQFTQTGGISYGPLSEVGNVYKNPSLVYEAYQALVYPRGGVTNFEPEDRYVWFNWNRYDDFTTAETGADRYFGLGRIDLGQLVDELQPAYAPDIMVPDTYYNNAYSTSVTVDCLCLFNKKLYFGTNFAGVYGEGSVYAANGYLKTGKINYGTAEQKRFARLELKGTVSPSGSDSIYTKVSAQDPDSTANTFTYGAGSTDPFLNLVDSYGEYAEVLFKLTSTTTTGAVTPVLNRWTLRSLPIPERQEEIYLPIILKDNVAHNLSSVTGLNPYDEFQTLRALLQSRVVVPLTMGDETVDVIVDSIITGQDQGVRMDRWNHDESWAEGIWYVKCITISATGVTATPVVVNNLVGPQGPQGATGPIGATGSIGPTGPTGPQGIQGIEGPTGPTGPVGATGNTGATGATGPFGGLPYSYSTTTTDSDPGTGKIQFDNSSVGSATIIYVDNVTSGGFNVSTYIDSWDDATSSPAGYLNIGWGSSNPSQTIYSISGAITSSGTSGTGYKKVPVTYVSGYTGTITNGLATRVAFTRNGDIGATGPTGAQGIQGATGPTGPTGAQGIQGIKGDTGDVGATGPQGPVGPTGAQGIQGIKGDTGDVGPTGPQGPVGATGAVGPTGPASTVPGPTGPAGSIGTIVLDDLTDVTIATPEEFQSLVYDGTSWINKHSSLVSYARNAETTTLTTGTVVYLFGATGDHATVKRADNTSDTTSSKTVGIVGANITASNNGPIITRGYVDGIDLSTGYSPGDVLWLGTGGNFTKTKPSAPDHLVFVGVAVRCTSNGIVYVATQNGYELDEIHNVSLPSPSAGEFLKYTGTLWVADDIDLGTDTSGDYVAGVTGGTGVTVTGGTGEGSTPSVAIGQSVATSASPTFVAVQSTATTGTAPFTVASQTVVTNLNADLLDGQSGSYYVDLANASGTLAIARGGTNSTATPAAGGINYGTGTAHAFTAAGTANQFLQSNGTSAPTWTSGASAGSTTFTATTTNPSLGSGGFLTNYMTYTRIGDYVFVNGFLIAGSTGVSAGSGNYRFSFPIAHGQGYAYPVGFLHSSALPGHFGYCRVATSGTFEVLTNTNVFWTAANGPIAPGTQIGFTLQYRI